MATSAGCFTVPAGSMHMYVSGSVLVGYDALVLVQHTMQFGAVGYNGLVC